MKKLLMVIPLVILLCFTFSYQQGEEVAEEPAMDITAETEAVRTADIARAEATEALDIDALMSFYADDAVRLSTGANSIRDKASERRRWSRWFADGWKSTWQPDKVEVVGSGDYAYTYGIYHNERGVGWETRRTQGGYLAVWKKQVDGSWKIIALK